MIWITGFTAICLARIEGATLAHAREKVAVDQANAAADRDAGGRRHVATLAVEAAGQPAETPAAANGEE